MAIARYGKYGKQRLPEYMPPKEEIKKKEIIPPFVPPPIPSKLKAEEERKAAIDLGTKRRQQLETLKKQGLTEVGARRALVPQLEAEREAELKKQQAGEVLTAQPSLPPTPEQIATAGLPLPTLHPVEAGLALTAAAGAAAGGAKLGALAGTMIAPGVGTAIGAAIGGVTGFVGAITWEQRQKVREAFDTFTAAKGNMDWVKIQLKAGVITTIQAQDLWDNSILALYAAERNIKLLNKDLNKFLSGGSDEAATIELFMRRLDLEEREFNLIKSQITGII